jgi:hypothetical protein
MIEQRHGGQPETVAQCGIKRFSALVHKDPGNQYEEGANTITRDSKRMIP